MLLSRGLILSKVEGLPAGDFTFRLLRRKTPAGCRRYKSCAADGRNGGQFNGAPVCTRLMAWVTPSMFAGHGISCPYGCKARCAGLCSVPNHCVGGGGFGGCAVGACDAGGCDSGAGRSVIKTPCLAFSSVVR